MGLLDGAGDGAHRTVAGAQGAALALVCHNGVIGEGFAGPGGAAVLHHMSLVLIPVIFECGKHRVGRGLAQAAQGILLDVVAQLLHLCLLYTSRCV